MFRRGIDKLKQKWAEDPITVIVVGSVAVASIAKLMDARSNYIGRHTWDREVARRERMGARR